jgi:prepilin-type N-terminal cleavage/methylation domain-containing protein
MGGFTLVEIMIVVAIIGLLASIAVPNFVNARKTAQATSCIQNLRQIDGAKQTWALEKGQGQDTVPTSDDLKPYIKLDSKNNIPGCPANGTYSIGSVSVLPTCSLSTLPDKPHIIP